MRDVAVLVLPGVAPFELGIACELFGLDRAADGVPNFDFALTTEVPGQVRTTVGFTVGVEHGLERLATADLVVTTPVPLQSRASPAVVEALRAAHERGAQFLSCCGGVFVLGDAGLLDGLRCTTHWRYTGLLEERFPAAVVDRDVLYVDDGPVISSAGSAAAIDAGLHLLRRELGAAAVGKVARRMVVPPHRDGGQAQFIPNPVLPAQACADDDLAALHAWALEHLAEDLSVERLAAHARMSPRTLARRFADASGTSPAAWVARMRLQRAQELLETTDLPVDAVAVAVGWGSGAVLRHHFSRLGTTPLAYRRTFAGTS
ncbi:helix-turn-helix domain-containing protein [Quadrisphaera sp. RL12-1S]|nr:helix-turn-helix domain-containing protein [Quadrisphaera sp. RL12-1S]